MGSCNEEIQTTCSTHVHTTTTTTTAATSSSSSSQSIMLGAVSHYAAHGSSQAKGPQGTVAASGSTSDPVSDPTRTTGNYNDVLPKNKQGTKGTKQKPQETDGNQIQDRMHVPVGDKNDKEDTTCDITLQSEGVDRSMSPTTSSSSSISSQGSTNVLRLQSKLTHGFSADQTSPSKTLSLKQQQQQQRIPIPIPIPNNVPNTKKETSESGPSSSSSTKKISTKQPNAKLLPPSTNKDLKGDKSRSQSTKGRPRSNSVPFDFQSTNRNKTKSTSPNNKSGQLRRGKWTVEEEAYVARVIQDFNSGYLNAPPGTTLRTYLSDKLNCDPMRITKKFTGDSCIGKRVFHPAVRCSSNAAFIDKAQTELDALERRWRKRLEMQQREVAKKQAASAAAAAAAVSGRMIHGKAMHSSLGNNGSRAVVAQTASWLDRANAILSHAHGHGPTSSTCKQESKIAKTSSDEVEEEMKEIERLIHEGPIIQKTSAGLPTLLGNSLTANDTSNSNLIPNGDTSTSKRKVSDDTSTNTGVHAHLVTSNSPRLEQVSSSIDEISCFREKRMRKSFSHNNIQDHEDAATLMGFLSSVRQAAASSASISK